VRIVLPAGSACLCHAPGSPPPLCRPPPDSDRAQRRQRSGDLTLVRRVHGRVTRTWRHGDESPIVREMAGGLSACLRA
jgi:hypothetical protein